MTSNSYITYTYLAAWTHEKSWVMPKDPYPSLKSMFCEFSIKTKLAVYRAVSCKTHVHSINTKPMSHSERISRNMVFIGTDPNGSISKKKRGVKFSIWSTLYSQNLINICLDDLYMITTYILIKRITFIKKHMYHIQIMDIVKSIPSKALC